MGGSQAGTANLRVAFPFVQAVSFQRQIPGNHCWGCGPLNQDGLGIESFWETEGESSVCSFLPLPQHMAGPQHVLNGGIIATIIDCHSICTAIAGAYVGEGRPIGSDPRIWCVTASLRVDYRRPTPIENPVRLRAALRDRDGRKSLLATTLVSEGEERAVAEVVAVRVPPEWVADPSGKEGPGHPART